MSRGKLIGLASLAALVLVALFATVFVQSCHSDTPTTPVEDAETSGASVRVESVLAVRGLR